jgi:hypothetical protein
VDASDLYQEVGPMQNPWMHLPERAPFVLDCDAAALCADAQHTRSDDYRVHTEVLPEPFVGAFSATVVLLSTNPGYCEADVAVHARDDFRSRWRANLCQQDRAYPFYLLDPQLDGPERLWWERHLKALLFDVGREQLARRLLCIEYSGYHSRRFGGQHQHLASQRYQFQLVRRAMARGALVVVMRGRELWFAAEPRLRSYERLVVLRNPQNPAVSPGNCGADYNRIVACLNVS